MNKFANVAIKGFIGTSLIDYPGCVASVLFVGGCNFRCPYCHNADLVLRPSPRATIPTGQLLAGLERRGGFVDGVVLTGGEPTLYPTLGGLLRTIRAMGFAVKLDTNGSRPDVLRDWLEQGLLDYVAMDVKVPRERYPEIAGRDVDVEAISVSVDLLRHCGLPHEFRTTVVPTLLDVEDVAAIARWIAGPSLYFLQQFQPNGCLDPRLEQVDPYCAAELETMAAAARPYLGGVQLPWGVGNPLEGDKMASNKSNALGRGYVQVYTGNCKGKTTAALGLAFRAAGHGLKTYIGQLMKGQHYGELEAAKMMQPYITIEQYGKPGWVHVQNPAREDDIQMAQGGLRRAKRAMLSGEYDIVVFDEINTAYYFHLLSLEDILDIIASKPDGVEVIFTGRYAPPELIAAADLVTEMVEVKHYYQEGVQARDGIER